MREKASSKKKDVPADSPDKTAPDKRGTKEFPFVIDTEGHQDTATEAEKKAREKDDKHNVDDWTLRWAGITAGATFAHGTVLVPDDPISGVPMSLDESIVDWNTYQRVQAGDVALYVYGYIAYFDFSSGRRKVQFGYKYLPTGPENFDSKRIFWTQCGPLDYNTHT